MKSKVTFKDRIVWTLISTAAVAIASTAAKQLAAWGWSRATHRELPKGIWAFTPAAMRVGKGAAGYLMHRFPPARALRS